MPNRLVLSGQRAVKSAEDRTLNLYPEGRARIVREATIAKPYGWIFFYQSNEFLDNGTAQLAGNAPIIVDRNTLELRVTGTARPLEEYFAEYEASIPPAALQGAPQLLTW